MLLQEENRFSLEEKLKTKIIERIENHGKSERFY
jgi:hypothetical protein